MTIFSKAYSESQIRTYDRATSVVFLKTNERFGGLSNMAGGFPLFVNGSRILTSEALYQVCRFPHLPEVQRLIIEQNSPMTAKMKSKPYRRDSRPDWDNVRVKVMRWCLRVKLAQNWQEFSKLLLETGDRPIVEESRKDDFWGAKPTDDHTLVGMNVLGRLLMELREAVKNEKRETFLHLKPLAIPDFLLFGKLIGEVGPKEVEQSSTIAPISPSVPQLDTTVIPLTQLTFFDAIDVPAVAQPEPSRPTQKGGPMIADLKPYPAYRVSGLLWLGDVPEHWGLIPNRGLMRRRKVLVGGQHNEYKLLSLTKQGVIVRDISSGKGKFSSDMGTSQEVRKGDLVFCLFDVPETPRTIGLSRYDGMITGAYTVFEWLGRGCIDYLEFFYRAMDDRKLLSPLYSGLRHTIPVERFLATKTPFPPPDEQAAIVRFLGWANGQLEKAIRAKRKVITLLNEQKQVIIHSAVTRGLDSSVPLKPSGIPWLGDIPLHWDIRRLKYFAHIKTGACDTIDRVDTGAYPFFVRSQKVERINSWSFDGEAVLTAGDGAGVAKVFHYVNGKFDYHQRVYRFSNFNGIIGRFFFLYLKLTLRFEALDASAKSTVDSLRLPLLKNFPIVVPPEAEQLLIVNSTNAETIGIDIAISRFEREIELLREYRTRLVADVVTGKLDVREAAAKLPDEVLIELPDNDNVDVLEDEPFEEEALV